VRASQRLTRSRCVLRVRMQRHGEGWVELAEVPAQPLMAAPELVDERVHTAVAARSIPRNGRVNCAGQRGSTTAEGGPQVSGA
jgi:hypothetical protein